MATSLIFPKITYIINRERVPYVPHICLKSIDVWEHVIKFVMFCKIHYWCLFKFSNASSINDMANRYHSKSHHCKQLMVTTCN
jgi:hypothetical protein